MKFKLCNYTFSPKTLPKIVSSSGFAAGIYTTNTAEACHYCAENSRANIIVVEDDKQLQKILQIKSRLPLLKAIVQYSGKPTAEGVYSVSKFLVANNKIEILYYAALLTLLLAKKYSNDNYF